MFSLKIKGMNRQSKRWLNGSQKVAYYIAEGGLLQVKTRLFAWQKVAFSYTFSILFTKQGIELGEM